MTVKPTQTLLLFLYVSIFLGILTLLPDEIVWAGNKIKIPKITAIFNSTKPQYADIKNITEKFETGKNTLSVSNHSADSSQKKEYQPFVPDSLRLNPSLRIQYPTKQDTLLFGFFRALKTLSNQDTLIRVLHFGDSQLEGDRITAFLREKFQADFGGSGVGICTIEDKLHSKTSIAQTTQTAWNQQVVYGPKYNRKNNNYYGVLGDKFQFSIPEGKWTKATVAYLKSPYATPTQQKIEKVKVLYRNPEEPFELSIQTPKGEILKEKIEPSKDFRIFYTDLEHPFEQITIGFASGKKSPEIYGVALDGKKGITFDNIPLRGSSGIEFSRINRSHLQKQLEKLNVKFLILQFGVNLVPNPVSDYGFYENMFYEQLKFLKSLSPNLSILVVGVSDMSRNMTGAYESYPNIEKIRDAQRKAAFRANCAFWDLYEAMGGKNSMPSWVFAKPVALANKDFTHFTSKGASIVSEMLYKAILTEYDEFNQLLN